jgi:hypothetical protein
MPHYVQLTHLVGAGLGEMTFLQLSTTYPHPFLGGHSIGYQPSPSSLPVR